MHTAKVTVYVNVSDDPMFFMHGLRPGDPIAEVDTFQFEIRDDSPVTAANYMWAVGNKEGQDGAGKDYPRDIRSLSVGDMLKVVIDRRQTFLAVASIGWRYLAEPGNKVVPLEGTSATSRGR